MNIIDGIIGLFSPQAAYVRKQWREELKRAGADYDAASADRLNYNWAAVNQAAELGNAPDRDTVRGRARDLERNADVAKAIIAAFVRNVIGGGIKLQARTDNNKLNKQIEELFTEWCRPRNCDVTGRQSFQELMRMAVVRKKVDGGILFLKCYTPHGILPFKLQALEVDELAVDQTEPSAIGNYVVNGIEVDEYRRPVGYWINKYDLNGIGTGLPKAAFFPADKVIFYAQYTRPSQIREMSDIAATITRIRDMNQFVEAVSQKARMESCFGLAIKKKTPVGGGPQVAMRSAKNAIDEKTKYKNFQIAPGMLLQLALDEEVETINPTNSGSNAADFLRVQQRLAGAGQGVSYEAASRDLSQVNYSSARQGLIEDEITYAEERERLIDTVMSEVYTTFLFSAELAKMLDIPAIWQGDRQWFKHEWVPAPRRWIDPLKEANANRIALQTGEKPFKQLAAEAGRDWQEQIDDIVEVQKYAMSKGLDLMAAIANVSGREAVEGMTQEA